MVFETGAIMLCGGRKQKEIKRKSFTEGKTEQVNSINITLFNE